MTVKEIIKSVRLCIDEEAVNAANLDYASAFDYGAGDDGLMNNIIKDKIGDAVRWVCLYAPAELLGGSDEQDSQDHPIPTGIIVDAEVSTQAPVDTDSGVRLYPVNDPVDCRKLEMPSDFIKLSRVRVLGWHKAVKTPISEDSEEYLQLYDDNGATATDDRPVAAIIDKSQSLIELWPSTEDDIHVEVSFVRSTDGNMFDKTEGGVTEKAYALPPRVKTAFTYYLAFLVLSAYGDSRSERMLEIAKMNFGK